MRSDSLTAYKQPDFNKKSSVKDEVDKHLVLTKNSDKHISPMLGGIRSKVNTKIKGHGIQSLRKRIFSSDSPDYTEHQNYTNEDLSSVTNFSRLNSITRKFFRKGTATNSYASGRL